jgi:hypothetical protein
MTTPPIATTASTPAPAASALFLFGDGFEEGCLPDFRTTTAAQAAEEARILSVTMSRARHGLVLSFARSVPEQSGRAQDSERWPPEVVAQRVDTGRFSGCPQGFQSMASWTTRRTNSSSMCSRENHLR